jgi:hypothetical protein
MKSSLAIAIYCLLLLIASIWVGCYFKHADVELWIKDAVQISCLAVAIPSIMCCLVCIFGSSDSDYL